MEKTLSFLNDPCAHPPYYVPQYRRNSIEHSSYKDYNKHANNKNGANARNGNRLYASNKKLTYARNENRPYASNGNRTYACQCGLRKSKINQCVTRKSEINRSEARKSKLYQFGTHKSKINRSGTRKLINNPRTFHSDKLGFQKVKLPWNTSLNQVVNQYALPLARKLNHSSVYISTKFRCSQKSILYRSFNWYFI